ncbi:hypothetical protein CK507_08315 [Pseudomonas sp. WN033]|nr:hypothetical protein CK507_08315 [Pseudomonas sp. WN033]
MKRIHVMAAVIRNAAGQILIAKRPDDAHQGGLWEFPGGKLEAGEDRATGLCRELLEELGISVTQARPLIDIRHDYPDKSVRLDVWLVTGFNGEAHGAEGQPVCWVAPSELGKYSFPAANAPIVQAAQLPERYLITPDVADEGVLFAGLERAYESGIRLVQLRQTLLAEREYQALAERVLARFGGQFDWLLKGNEPPEYPGVGWHLTARQLRELSVNDGFAAAGRSYPDEPASLGRSALQARSRGSWLAASCHNAEELLLAEKLGVDFVTLSPVLPTPSHPDAAGLGWEAAQALIGSINKPVYLLGGMSPERLSEAFDAGAQGIAGIRGLWCSPNQAQNSE